MNSIKLKELCLNITDGEHNSVVDDENGKYFLLSSKNIKNGSIIYDKKDRKINDSAFSKIRKRTKLEKDDVLITTVGTIGEVAIIKDEKPIYDFQRSVGIIKCNKTKLLPKYLFYSLMNDKSQLIHNSEGAVQKCLFLTKLGDLNIVYRDLLEQQKIAHVLDLIDSKIELNNKINDVLQRQMKLLYDYWFVQFDFPDSNGKPYKSSGGKMVYNPILKREIPEGWEVKCFKEVTEVLTGKEDANFSTKEGKYMFFTCSNNVLKCNKYAFEGKALLIAGNGDFNVKHYSGKFNAYQRTYVLIPYNSLLRPLMYLSSRRMIMSFQKGSSGSIVKFITKRDIEDIKIVIPQHNIFMMCLNDIMDFVEKTAKENLQLAKLRDFLLPLLMNGQVSVDD